MDSHLASVLISGSLDVQNGSQRAEGSGPVTEVLLDAKDRTSAGSALGNLQPCPVKGAVTIRRDVLSINGKKPEVGGTSEPASQETSKIGVFRQPITVKTGVPVLRSRPIRLKIVVPTQCKKPITDPAISLTKDFSPSRFGGSVSGSSVAGITDTDRSRIQISMLKNEEEIKEVASQKTENVKHESFREREAERLCEAKEGERAQMHSEGLETPLISNIFKEETTEGKVDKNIPPIFHEMDLQPCTTFDEVEVREQTEPLDLSLPKKRENRERRCGRFLDDSGCESLLIMEVDEYEGEGDRDIVEEDEEESVQRVDEADILEDSLLSPSVLSTSVFTSLSLSEGDTENLLLIDDQGIPYTLSPEGLKVPQVDVSVLDDPLPGQNNSVEVERRDSLRLASLADPKLSQGFDTTLRDGTDSPAVAVDRTEIPEVFTSLITKSDSPTAAEPSVQSVQANAVLSPSSGIAVPTQPIQLFTNPPANAAILLLSSSTSTPQLSSAPLGLTLPLSVSQAAPSSSAAMFLLLSPVPSSSGDSSSTSTPIAVLDPSTGQLSQIAAASAPVALPLSSGQVSSLGSPLPSVSHPVIRLSPNNPPVILPGVNNVTSSSVLTSLVMGSSCPSLQTENHAGTTPLLHSQVDSHNSNSGSKAIAEAEAEAEQVSNENNNKPLSSAASSPHPQSASMAFDPSAQSSSDAQSPASELHFDSSNLHMQHLPLDDHLYFSHPAASPSPPTTHILSSSKLKPLNPLDPLDPLSPVTSPNATGPRRVLYCQQCLRVFFYLSDLERHAITHSQKKPHVCQQCGKAFKRSSHLQVSAESLWLSLHPQKRASPQQMGQIGIAVTQAGTAILAFCDL